MVLPISPIILFGLPHKVDIFDMQDADDGEGGIINIFVSRFSDLDARITVMTDEDEQQGFGNATGEHWKVLLPIVDGVEGIERSDFLRLSASSALAPITRKNKFDAVQDYRITYIKQKIDNLGLFHHVALVIELEDQNG